MVFHPLRPSSARPCASATCQRMATFALRAGETCAWLALCGQHAWDALWAVDNVGVIVYANPPTVATGSK